MRQIQVQVPPEAAEHVLTLAAEHEAAAPIRQSGHNAQGDAREVIGLALPNSQLGSFVESVSERIPEALFVFAPAGVLVLEPPLKKVQRSTRHVETRSAVELVLGSMQSIGSWSGMLTYAALSGVVAAYAVIFNFGFLLVAAMLIAPLGAPAMVVVIGTAFGDWSMIRRGAVRFVAAITVLALGAVLLGLLYGLEVSTSTMEQISSLSLWTALLASVGGAAGAESQVQSDRDSLVTGTATGFLIAVSLSPPAAVLGLAITIGRWDYAAQMAFTLVLTFSGIMAGGWLALHLNGARPHSTEVAAGRARVRSWAVGLAVASLAALVYFQSLQAPSFRKADLASQAVLVTRSAVEPLSGVQLLEANAHFTRSDLLGSGGESLIVRVMVELDSDNANEVTDRVRSSVRDALTREIRDVVPYVDVVTVPGPEPAAGPI